MLNFLVSKRSRLLSVALPWGPAKRRLGLREHLLRPCLPEDWGAFFISVKSV